MPETESLFSRTVATLLLLVICVAAVLGVVSLLPTGARRVFADSATNPARQVIAFTNATVTGPSGTFFNNGQGAHYLTYCKTGGGSGNVLIDLEQSFDGVTNWTPMVTGTLNTGGNCQTIQAGGYYQNVRANILNITGVSSPAFSAWYSGTPGPIAFYQPAIGPFNAPFVCNGSAGTVAVANGASAQLVPISGLAVSASVYVCDYTISFAATPGTGSITFEQGTGTVCSTGLASLWVLDTTAATQQPLNSPPSMTPIFAAGAGNELCLLNNSGANLVVNYTTVVN